MTSFEYIRERCGNRKWGGRIIYHNYKLCFQPLTFEQAEDGGWYYSDHISQEEYEKLKIVARGIVPHYIRYEHEKNLKELFADYYNDCFETFKNNRRNDIELMLKSEKDIEIAFVETMIDEERCRIDYSKKELKQYAEYFTDEENEILRQVCNGFMRYLQDRLKDLKPEQEQPTDPTNTKQPKDEAKTKQPKRRITPKISNEDDFRKYFTLKFQNKGYFDYLVSDIKDLATINDCSIVAKMIYNTDSGFINSFTTFAGWCRRFFECIGVKVSEGHNFSKSAKPTDELKRKFYYL